MKNLISAGSIFIMILLFSCSNPATKPAGRTFETFRVYRSLVESRFHLVEMGLLVSHWANAPGQDLRKNRLKEIVTKEFDEKKKALLTDYLDFKSEKEVDAELSGYFTAQQHCLELARQIMKDLDSFEKYESPEIVFRTRPMVTDADGDFVVALDKALQLVDKLVESTEKKLEQELAPVQ